MTIESEYERYFLKTGISNQVFKIVDGELISAIEYSEKFLKTNTIYVSRGGGEHTDYVGAYLYTDNNGKVRKLSKPRSFTDLAKIGWHRVTYMNEMPSYDSTTEYIETQYEIVDNFIQVTYVKKTLEV